MSQMFLKAGNEGSIHEIRIAREAPIVSHLFFAKDSFIFGKTTLEEAREIKDIRENSCEASGQLINYHKSVVYFSKGACPKSCKAISTTLGMRIMQKDEKY